MSTTQENLEERIVRIRKRDEEIEKKHRLAEEDRLLALKHNAMVKTKSPTDDDWPKGHKYDSLDFTYDQNESLEDEKSAKKSEKEKHTSKPGREYKKFPDGSGPPPDPTYNFLKDAERDGITEKAAANDRKDWRQSNGGNNTSRNKNGLNNSFRGRNSKQRNGNNSGGNRYPKHDEYGSWKNERDRIDESRIGRQKSGDGKWRREWDTDKNNEDDIAIQMEKAAVHDSRMSQQQQQQMQQQHHHHQQQQQQQQQPQQQRELRNQLLSSDLNNVLQKQQQQQQHIQPQHQQQQNNLVQQQQHHFSPRSPTQSMRVMQPNQYLSDNPMEKRGNIMVSVSQDGEVKSVKFQSTRAIGTGRVGPRQNSKPQFSIQKDPSFENAFPTVTQYQPDNTEYFIAPVVMPISPRRLGPSLQDRLNRHRQPQQPQNTNNSFEGKNNQSSASSENAQIAVSF